MSRGYDKTVVVCRSGHEYLYDDFADEIVNYDPDGNSDRWLHNGKKVKIPKRVLGTYLGADKVIQPRWGNCVSGRYEFFKYGVATDEKYDIVFHARAMTKYHQSHLNYPVKNYIKAMRELGVDPLRCASIGSRSGAFHVPRTNDLRGAGMGGLCGILASAKVCVGTSSGPMHLASFCGCPHVVITGREYQKAIKTTNRKRYEKLWNPFKTVCTVLDKHRWNPPHDKVAKAVGAYL